MPKQLIAGKEYRLPGSLNEFQTAMYVHLINYKWDVLGIPDPGEYKRKGKTYLYDAMFPQDVQDELHPLHRPILDRFLEHQRNYPFKLHPMAKHMASSQLACANLFLPLMIFPEAAAEVLRVVKPDLAGIATDRLDEGFKIEFWNDPDVVSDGGKGLLGDHCPRSGTDSDFAIAYRDAEGKLCLWLIEHKLAEAEFTRCGGARSKGRLETHRCDSAPDILEDLDLCYYQSVRAFNYWPLTLEHGWVFPRRNIEAAGGCPFIGGMNQLWRNQLLAAAIEKSSDWPYEKVFFSVVHHPRNPSLIDSMEAFRALLDESDRFSWFTSDSIVNAAKKSGSSEVRDWAEWYGGLYWV